MPTLPLYDPTAAPDGGHSVRSPGGYEWWYFDAEDAATDTQLVAIFLDGFVFHPGYLRRHFAYLKNPTRVPPVTAADFPCAYFCVYRGGKVWRQFMTQYPAGTLRAERDRPRVTVGPNEETPEAGGAIRLTLRGSPWYLTARGPRTDHGVQLEADLKFEPLSSDPPAERPFFSRALAGADHHWVVANPLCRAFGTVRCGGETLAFSGRGYHDHNFGTGPIGPGLKRWAWGRAFFGGGGSNGATDPARVVTFHHAEPRDPALRPETHLLEVGGPGDAPAHPPASLDYSARSLAAGGLAFPRSVDLGDALSLRRPRVVDAAPFYLRLQYDAVSRGERGRAFCEVAHPHRLRWPVLGRMIEMSIDVRS